MVPPVGTRARVLLFGAALLSCAPPGAFECQADAQCSGGRCELNGWCSFPDGNCESGQRYGEHAGGGLAGECVGEGDTDVGTSEPSTGTASSATTVDPTMPLTASSVSITDSGESSSGICGDGTRDDDEACDDANGLDGDGCDNDCTESGETLWTYLSEVAGDDAARDVIALSDGSAVACGDVRLASGDPYPAVIVLDATGAATFVTELLDAGYGNAWGIVGSAQNFVVGGTRSGPGDAGFLASLTLMGEIGTFTVPTAVFDVALYGPLVMVAGKNPDGSAAVVAYDDMGVIVEDYTVQQLPLIGTAWDLGVSARSPDLIYVAGADEGVLSAFFGAAPAGGEPVWASSWSMPGTGGAYGLTVADSGEIIVSGSIETSGIVTVLDPESGSERWSQTISSEIGAFANIHKAAPGPSGEVVGIGWVATSATDADIWIGKFSSEGALLWQRTFAGTGSADSNGWGITVDSAGLITGVGGLQNEDTGYDAWVVRLEP